MPERSTYFKYISVADELWFYDYDVINWKTFENALMGPFLLVGSGVINGWDVVDLSLLQDEVDALPDSIKNQLEHTESCMMVKVTPGDGVLGVYAAYTPDATYLAFPLIAESVIYYVYAVPTDCLVSEQRATVIFNDDPTYASTHDAACLAKVTTYYDPVYQETYIYRIEYDNNRRDLKNLKSAAMDAIEDVFRRHQHTGGANAPSQINLSTMDIEVLSVPAASTLFTLTPFLIAGENTTTSNVASLPTYAAAKVYLNGRLLASSEYDLDHEGGKLYLKNSVNVTDSIQIKKYLDPAETEIARGPQDDPPSSINGGYTDSYDLTEVDSDYRLKSGRIGNVSASKVSSGTVDRSNIKPIDHWGMNRIRENLSLDPKVETRSSDRLKYWLVPPDTEMAFDTHVVTIQFSKIIGGTVVSIPHGLFLVNGQDVHDLTRLGHSEDNGRVLKIYENFVEGEHGGENRFNEIYLLTDLGKIFVSYDAGESWEALQIPILDEFFATSFTVSIDKVEREVNNTKTYDYYKVFNLGSNMGLYSARILGAKGNAAGGSDLQIIESIPWSKNELFEEKHIAALQEIVTLHTVTSDQGTSTSYDRTLYISAEDGFYSGNRKISGSDSMGITDILWSTNNCLLAISTQKAYVSHTAKYVEEVTAETTTSYWKHPLSQIDETLHVTKDFSADGKLAHRISQEWGKARYLVGLGDGVSVSSIDASLSFTNNNPVLPIVLSVESGTKGAIGLGITIGITSDHSVSGLPLSLYVKSLADVANDATLTDDQKEMADGWDLLDWEYSDTEIENVRSILSEVGDQAAISPVFGEDQTVSYLAASDWGIWKSSDTGKTWIRPMEMWPSGDPLVVRDGTEVSSTEYTKLQPQQAVLFNSEQSVDAVIKIEKDFKDYFAANGPWDQADADLVVYLNNVATDYQYEIDSTEGKITFLNPLTKNVDVKMTLLYQGAYLDNVGTIPHSEILTAFVASSSVKTTLSSAISGNERIIKVESTSAFPSKDSFYILVDDEKIKVTRKDSFSFYSVKSRPTVKHDKGADVYLVEVKDVYGLEDEISIITSDLPYHMHSTVTSNLLRTQVELSRVWPDMFEDPPTAFPHEGTQKQGVINELIFTPDYDSFDPNGAVASLVGGFFVPVSSVPGAPRVISSMKKPYESGNFIVGSDKGIWRYDGSSWKQLSNLDGAGIVYYVEEASNGDLLAGADNGLWSSSDDGETWTQSGTFFQQQLCHLSGELSWISSTAKPYDIYGKDDGLAMTISNWDGVSASSFRSDHYDDVDDYRVYGLYEGTFFRINKETGQRTSYESIWICSENGLYVTYSGTRLKKDGTPNPYSALLKGREAVDPGYRSETTTDAATGETTTEVTSGSSTDLSKHQGYLFDGYDDNGDPIYRRLKFFGVFPDPRPRAVPIIFLTNDGLRVARNWRWVDPVPQEDDAVLYLAWEATPLSTSDPDQRITCNCYATGEDTTIDPDSEDAWMKYKVFVGTSKGLYRSYDGCHTLEKCQNIPGATSIYCLDYSSNRLHAGTSSGYWYSDNDGDDWTQPIQDVGNSVYPEGHMLAQTFLAEQTSVTKVSLYLHPKPVLEVNVGDQPERPVYNLIAELRTTDEDGVPTEDVLATSAEVDASDVMRDAYYDFLFPSSVVLPDPSGVYAIVLRESGLTGDSYVGWVTSPLDNAYSYGSAFVEYSGVWTEFSDRDHFFKIHYLAPSEAVVVEHSVSFSQDNSRKMFVDVDNQMQLDMRFLVSFCLDASGSMVDADPEDFRTSEPVLFFREILRRAPQSYVDIWAFSQVIIEQTYNGPTKERREYMAAFGSVQSEGSQSRVWSGLDTAVGNLDPSTFANHLMDSGQSDEVVELMRQMNRIDYYTLPYIDPTYDPTTGFDGIATHGKLVNYLVGQYAETGSPMAFLLSDGYDNVGDFEPSEVVASANGVLGDGLTPVYCMPLGDNYDSTNMAVVAEGTSGEMFQISGDPADLRKAFNLLLNDKQKTIFQGSYEEEVVFEESTFLQAVEIGAIVPVTSDLTFEFCVTYDGYNWGQWREVPANNRFDILEFVLGVKFRIKAWLGNEIGGNYYDIYGDDAIYDEQAWTYGCRYARYYGYYHYTGDDPAEAYYTYRSSTYPSPTVYSLKYWTVTPSETHLFTERGTSDSIHEYLLAPSEDAPERAVVSYAIVRGSDPDMAEAEEVKANKKGVLPDRRRSIYFTPSVDQVGLATENMDPNTRLIFMVVDENGDAITWDDSLTEITVYLNNTELDPKSTPYSIIADRGLIWFEQPIASSDKITADLHTPGLVASRLGELAVGTNRRTYYASGGPWPSDSTVVPRVNDSIQSGGYVLDNLEGSIFFFDELLPDDVVTLEIGSSGYYRAGVKILNYQDGDIDPPGFALMFSEAPTTDTDLLASRTVMPEALEVQLLPEEPNLTSRLEVSYVYYQQDGNKEKGTTIKWYRKTLYDGAFFEYVPYRNRNVMRMTDVPSINPSSPFQEHDQWYVVVTPQDANSTGNPVISNTVVIGSHVPPYVLDDATIVGNEVDISSDNTTPPQELEASYTYKDPNATGDQTETDNSIIKWYKNGNATSIHTGKTLASELQEAGDVIFYVITPYNNELEGFDITSSEVTITAESTAEA